MSVHIASGTQQTYRANKHATVLSEVCTVHCVLMPRAILVAGYNEDGMLVMAHYNSYVAPVTSWHTDFFEHDFINEKLLGVPQAGKDDFYRQRYRAHYSCRPIQGAGCQTLVEILTWRTAG